MNKLEEDFNTLILLGLLETASIINAEDFGIIIFMHPSDQVFDVYYDMIHND